VHEALVCISFSSLEHPHAGRVVRGVPDRRCMRHGNCRNVASFGLSFTCLIGVSDYIPCDLTVVRSKLGQCETMGREMKNALTLGNSAQTTAHTSSVSADSSMERPAV
jgi:hypothetical protein